MGRSTSTEQISVSQEWFWTAGMRGGQGSFGHKKLLMRVESERCEVFVEMHILKKVIMVK
jgi:hypothetical protein